MKTVLLYCLQRSGSFYLEKLIKTSFRNLLFIEEDKEDDRSYITARHFRLYDDKRIIPEPKYHNDQCFPDFKSFKNKLKEKERPDYFLLISKDPYSWLTSYRRWAEKCGWPEKEHHYIQEYNLFYGKWLKFSEETDSIKFVRYIDLLNNKQATLKKIQTSFGLKPRLLSDIFSKVFTLKVRNSEVFTWKKRQYYLNKEYLKEITVDELSQINKVLDKDVIMKLGYEEVPTSELTNAI